PTGAPQPEKGEREQQAGGDAMSRKQVNDAAAYIRGLAQLRGRNAEWAEQAVREAVSLSASEALELKVIDYLAADLPGLLIQLDGQTLQTSTGERQLQTANAPLVHHEPDWRVRLLAGLTNPRVALTLMLIGTHGPLFQLAHPGPGAGGGLG